METKDQAQFHIVLVKGWIKKGDTYLLAQRGSKELHKPGAWSLPGGKVENEVQRDILQHTLRTEIREEVGLEISDSIELVYNNSFTRVDGAHVVGMTFLCHHASGEAQALEDTADVRWLTLGELNDFAEAEDWLRVEIEALAEYELR